MPARSSLLRRLPLLVLALAVLPGLALGQDGAPHGEDLGLVLLDLAVILLAAKLGGEVVTRIGQPAVLGELVVGILLGNAHHVGLPVFHAIPGDPVVGALAGLGVILLLFEVGLESTVADMLKVGAPSFAVATVGVVFPMLLGWLVGRLLLPEASVYVHVFLGAALSATSVGITARVLQDLGRAQTREARIVLGAAVIDDVLGLVVLAVVTGLVAAADAGRALSLLAVGGMVAKASLFLVGALVLGVWLSPRMFRVASKLQTRGVLLALGLAFCFLMSWLSGAIGLAPIVGAFAAGLILEQLHYRDFTRRGEHGLEELVKPIASFLVPVFFVVMGMRTDLTAFLDLRVLGLAAGLIAAAIAGKQACGGAVWGGVDRLTVGLGMIPRGEVGLIFANIGLTLRIGGRPLLDAATYSAVVLVVVVTTLVTPPALRWSLRRLDRAADQDAKAAAASRT
ncbi:MAG: cation:proton antiporter [Anaeromyxobacter sp.]